MVTKSKSEITKAWIEELKQKHKMLRNKDEEDKVVEEEEIIVKFDYVATGSWDKSIIIWNAQRGSQVYKLEGHD